MPRTFEQYCKRGHDKLDGNNAMIETIRAANGRRYTVFVCRVCRNAMRQLRRREIKDEMYKQIRKKPQMFPPCSHGNHHRCAYVVLLAGAVFSKCQCRCHRDQPIHNPKRKENYDFDC